MDSVKFTCNLFIQTGKMLLQLIEVMEPLLKIIAIGYLFYFVMSLILSTTKQNILRQIVIVFMFAACFLICMSFYLNMSLSVIILCFVGRKIINEGVKTNMAETEHVN